MSLLYLALTLWLMGYPDQAATYNAQAQVLARELDHPFSRNPALVYTVVLQSFSRQLQDAHDLVHELMTLSSEYAFPHWTTLSTILRGCVLIHDQQHGPGIDCIAVGLAARRDQGAGLSQSWILGQLAQGHLAAGRFDEGRASLEEAQKIADTSAEHWWDAELWRLQGQLLLKRDDHDPTAEDCFRQALEIARQQQAKSLELRAVLNLSQLWHQQGRSESAKTLLASVYSWFHEGMTTPDLQEATSLLSELSASP